MYVTLDQMEKWMGEIYVFMYLLELLKNVYPDCPCPPIAAQCSNPAIRGQGPAGYTWLVGRKSTSEKWISIRIKPRDVDTPSLPGLINPLPLVCALGQTIPVSNACV